MRVLRGATVLDGLGGRIENARVTIATTGSSRCRWIETPALPAGAIVESVAGRFLIPGLIDSHVHWGGSGGIGAAPNEQTDQRLAHDTGRRWPPA